MFKKPISLVSFILFLAVLFTFLYAADKKPKPQSLQNSSGQIFVVQPHDKNGGSLIEKLNHSEEFKYLSAEEKVRMITKELRKNGQRKKKSLELKRDILKKRNE